MPEVRALRDSDLAEVAELQESVFRGQSGVRSSGLEAHLRLVFLEHPWRDLGLHSLVRTDDSGRIAGFLGVIPRPMSFRGRSIRVAVCHRFAVRPDTKDRTGGLHLLRALFAGPQDMSVTDSANLEARAVWQSLRGDTCCTRTLTWTRYVRPVACVNRFAQGRPLLRACTLPLRLFHGPLDALIARRVRAVERVSRPAGLVESEFTDAAFFAHAPAIVEKRALRPEYDERSLAWLLRCLRDNHARGSFRAVLLRDARGEIAGWYLYYRNPGGVNEVLQTGASARHAASVLDHLFWRSQEDGAIAVSGRLDAAILAPLVRRRVCWSLPDGSISLVHSRDPAISAALQSGDAWFTALEGELWLRSPMDSLG